MSTFKDFQGQGMSSRGCRGAGSSPTPALGTEDVGAARTQQQGALVGPGGPCGAGTRPLRTGSGLLQIRRWREGSGRSREEGSRARLQVNAECGGKALFHRPLPPDSHSRGLPWSHDNIGRGGGEGGRWGRSPIRSAALGSKVGEDSHLKIHPPSESSGFTLS